MEKRVDGVEENVKELKNFFTMFMFMQQKQNNNKNMTRSIPDMITDSQQFKDKAAMFMTSLDETIKDISNLRNHQKPAYVTKKTSFIS